MAQQETWENEYRKGKLVSKDSKPQAFLSRYFRKLKFVSGKDYAEWSVLDLGSGTGRNSNYLAEKGAEVVGIEIAKNAIDLAERRAREMGVKVQYLHQSIGEIYPFGDSQFDLVLDITSSNSLSEAERKIYLEEVGRVLKPGGSLFLRALCLDGDKNAKNLLKLSPGSEHHTYIIEELGLTERVFTREELKKLYEPLFAIKKLEKISTYTPFNNQKYRRNFFFAWLVKK